MFENKIQSIYSVYYTHQKSAPKRFRFVSCVYLRVRYMNQCATKITFIFRPFHPVCCLVPVTSFIIKNLLYCHQNGFQQIWLNAVAIYIFMTFQQNKLFPFKLFTFKLLLRLVSVSSQKNVSAESGERRAEMNRTGMPLSNQENGFVYLFPWSGKLAFLLKFTHTDDSPLFLVSARVCVCLKCCTISFSKKGGRSKSDLLPCVFHRVLDRISIFNRNQRQQQNNLYQESVFFRLNFERRRVFVVAVAVLYCGAYMCCIVLFFGCFQLCAAQP